MLDLDVVVAARQRHPGGAFQRAAAVSFSRPTSDLRSMDATSPCVRVPAWRPERMCYDAHTVKSALPEDGLSACLARRFRSRQRSLLPIPGDKPAGADPRDDVSPSRSTSACATPVPRRASWSARPSTDRGDAGLPPPWRTVRSLAEKALRDDAKDLEVATWLTEALVRAAGLRGLATGAARDRRADRAFWDGLYPTPDEDGIETRVAPLAGLSGQGVDGTLMQPLRKTALFTRPDGMPFGYWQYELSVELRRSPTRRRQQRLDAGVMPFDDVEKEARARPARRIGRRCRGRSGALEAWSAIGRARRACRRGSPSTAACATCLPRWRTGAAVRAGQAQAAEAPRRGRGAAPMARSARRRAPVPGRATGRWARGRAARLGRDRGLVPAQRTELAAGLHAGRGGAPRPHDLARAGGGTAARRPTRNACCQPGHPAAPDPPSRRPCRPMELIGSKVIDLPSALLGLLAESGERLQWRRGHRARGVGMAECWSDERKHPRQAEPRAQAARPHHLRGRDRGRRDPARAAVHRRRDGRLLRRSDRAAQADGRAQVHPDRSRQFRRRDGRDDAGREAQGRQHAGRRRHADERRPEVQQAWRISSPAAVAAQVPALAR